MQYELSRYRFVNGRYVHVETMTFTADSDSEAVAKSERYSTPADSNHESELLNDRCEIVKVFHRKV